MKFYLLFCMSLNLAYLGVARNIEKLNTESALNSTENPTTTTITQLKCPKNMIPVFKDSEDSGWTCICLKPFVHLPVYNACTELFRRGPCESGNFVIQPPYNVEKHELGSPRCATNPCLEDGLVPYSGTCRNITTNPICNYGQPFFIETTLEIGCGTLPAPSVIGMPSRTCPPDSRPDKYGICRRKL